jgi:hypothetical protein
MNPPPAETANIIFDQIVAGGSAAALVAALFVFVLRHTTTSRERSEQMFAQAIEKMEDSRARGEEKTSLVVREMSERHQLACIEFTKAITEQGIRCDTNTAALLREERAANEAREKQLFALIEAWKHRDSKVETQP